MAKPDSSRLNNLIREDAVDEVRALLEAGADPNFVSVFGSPVLLDAASHDKIEIAKLLLKAGAKIMATSNMGHTALHEAALMGRIEMMSLLLKEGAEINARSLGKTVRTATSSSGHYASGTPLHWALCYENVHQGEAVEFLLSNGADPEVRTAEGLLAVHIPGDVHEAVTALKAFLKAVPSQVNKRTGQGFTALHLAAERQTRRIAEVLISFGAEVNAKIETTQKTALHLAAETSRAVVLELLLDKGAQVDARSKDSSTPLLIATFHKRLDAARALLRRGADPNLTDKSGLTALHLAALQNRDELVTLLLGQGADPNMQSTSDKKIGKRLIPAGTTPAGCAKLVGSKKIEALLQKAPKTAPKSSKLPSRVSQFSSSIKEWEARFGSKIPLQKRIDALSELEAQGPAALQLLFSFMFTPEKLRKVAIEVQMRLLKPGPEGPDELVAVLSMLVSKGPSSECRRAATHSLGNLGPKAAAAAPALVGALQSTAPYEQWPAAEALGLIGPAAASVAVPAFAETISSYDLDIQGYSLRSLGGMGPAAAPALPAVVRLLKRFLEAENWQMWTYAMRPLAGMGEPAATKDVLALLKKGKAKGNESVRLSIAGALYGMNQAEEKDTWSIIDEALAGKDENLHYEALQILSLMASRSAASMKRLKEAAEKGQESEAYGPAISFIQELENGSLPYFR